MREIVQFEAEEARPERAEVLEQQGLPEEGALSPRLRHLVDEALAAAQALAAPSAVYEELTAEEFAGVLRPLAVDEAELAVGRVYPRAQGLALFVVTLGAALPARVKQLFAEDALAEGYMLDAVGSVAADLLAKRLSARFERVMRGRGHEHARVLPYSPGYCGWPTGGQRTLFARLRPEEIGVTLGESCLMSPVKSVSGVLVAAPGEGHRFRPDLPACDACRRPECGKRMASVLERPRRAGPAASPLGQEG